MCKIKCDNSVNVGIKSHKIYVFVIVCEFILDTYT